MSEADKLREEIKRELPKKMGEQLDKMKDDEISTLYARLRKQGKLRK
jgi:hypothetical protein